MNDARDSAALHPTPPTRHSAVARVLRLARKELREILRDRRTIVTLIAMPILLYPLMSVLFLQFALANKLSGKTETEVFRLGALTETEARIFERRFEFGEAALRRARGDKGAKPANGDKPHDGPRLAWQIADHAAANDEARAVQFDQLKEGLRDGSLDLIIAIPDATPGDLDPRQPAKDRYLPCRIYARPDNPIAQSALAYITTVLAAADTANLKARLNVPGVRPGATVLGVQTVMLEKTGPEGLISLSALVPLILILMTITGAVYPAIDLTAGERERGTLEILVAAPVPRFELLTAKYISVVTVAVLNAIVNLLCMTATVMWSGVNQLLPGLQTLTPLLLLQVFALLLLFAAFFSAVLLCLTSFARSFKEAQAYLIPLMLASLAPGIMAMMPGLQLGGLLAALPLVNIVLMARDLFDTGVDPVNGTIVVVTTLLYALAALSLAARVFGAESVLYSEQSSWADLLRRPQEPQKAASISAMLWCLALMVPIQFVLVALVREFGSMPPIGEVAAGVAVNLLLFGFLPMLFTYLGRVELRSGLGLTKPTPAAVLAAIVLGLSLWPLELKVLEWTGDTKALEERFGAVVEALRKVRESVGWWVLAIVVVPAILEEIFFRGLLFNAVKTRCGPAVTIGVTGVLFGVTHVILGGAIGLDRLVPSLALGLILSAVCWHTGSLWPSMIQHVCHNAILVIASPEHLPWQWLVASGLGIAVSVSLLWRAGRRSDSVAPVPV
jgi:ABC-2 type transport system permease protein/sodium transport system permease protein